MEFVDELVGRDVSQQDLELAYEKHDHSEPEPERHCPFLDSGPFADAREESFRDIDDFAVPCVLDFDLSRVLADFRARKPIDEFIVPVPRNLC